MGLSSLSLEESEKTISTRIGVRADGTTSGGRAKQTIVVGRAVKGDERRRFRGAREYGDVFRDWPLVFEGLSDVYRTF